MISVPPETFDELRQRYEQGERAFVGAELEEDADLSEVCLDGVDLSKAFVIASFKGASLRRAVFRDANLKTCDFSGADLTGSDFRGAALCSARFTGACLDDAKFEGAFIHSYTFKRGEHPDC